MRIKRGFLTSLMFLSLGIALPHAGGDETPDDKEPQQATTSNQVPLRSDMSRGWSQYGASAPSAAVGPGWPAGAPSGVANAAWPPPRAGFPMMPAAPFAQASFQTPPAVPQPFPGAPAISGPVAPMEGPMGAPPVGEYYEGEDYVEAPYPGPFDGWIDNRDSCVMCGGGGCDQCRGVGGGLLGWLITGMRPYGEGGICAPRWYDVTLDMMFLTREDAGRNIVIATEGINGDPALSVSDLTYQEEPGMRFTGATQLTAGLTAEFTYFGLFNWSSSRRVDGVGPGGQGDFYSIYSFYGTNPQPALNAAGFDQTDRSTYQQIDSSSRIDNFELNFRRRWSMPNCLFQGSWLCGVRYIYHLEDFGYHSTGGDDLLTPGVIEVTGRQSTLVAARNSLTGFQIGGDIWTTVTPGISVGGELKAGVFGNYAKQQTIVRSETFAPLPPATALGSEEADINDIAFAGEGRVEVIYRTGPNWTLRAGYSFLFVDGIALAAEQLAPGRPINLQFVGGLPRPTVKNDDGNVFYHGGFGGFEYVW